MTKTKQRRMRRDPRLGVAVAALTMVNAIAACTCSDRMVGDEPRGYGQPTCLWLISPRGYYDDGSSGHVGVASGPGDFDYTAAVCLCVTDEEYAALGDRLERRGTPEPGTLLEEFNELALQECKRLSAIQQFVRDECSEYYEAGEWLKDIYPAEGNWADGPPDGFACIDED